MVKPAIVEDDKGHIESLKTYIDKYMKENGASIEVKVRDGNQIVFDYQPVYDIILMDIEMPGMAAAQEIRKVDKDVVIIFITNMAQYAIQGYKVRRSEKSYM